MPAPLMSKDEVIRRLMRAFRHHGYQASSLSMLSKEVGLGKASLYHYFPGGKQEMAEAVLGYVSDWFKHHIYQPVQQAQGPREKLSRMAMGFSDFYEQGELGCAMNVFSMGDSGKHFHVMLESDLLVLEGVIQDIIVSAGIDEATAIERAEQAVIQLQGALVVARVKESREPFLKVLAGMQEALLAKPA